MAVANAETVGVLIKCFDRICNNRAKKTAILSALGCEPCARAVCSYVSTKIRGFTTNVEWLLPLWYSYKRFHTKTTITPR